MAKAHIAKASLSGILGMALAFCLASCCANHPAASSDKFSGQKAVYSVITNAIDEGNWDELRRLTKPGMGANSHIQAWEKAEHDGNPVRVGELIDVKNDESYFDGKPCIKYTFELKSKDGIRDVHQLQILFREEGGKFTLLDFWKFGW